jgi:hypothetical protein
LPGKRESFAGGRPRSRKLQSHVRTCAANCAPTSAAPASRHLTRGRRHHLGELHRGVVRWRRAHWRRGAGLPRGAVVAVRVGRRQQWTVGSLRRRVVYSAWRITVMAYSRMRSGV